MKTFRPSSLLLHEWLLIPFVLGLWAALLIHAAIWRPVTLSLALGFLVLVCVILLDVRRRLVWTRRVRLGFAYLFLVWIYLEVAEFVSIMNLRSFDGELLSIDRWLFGETPAALFSVSPPMNELMSGGYLSYQFYVHGSVISCFFIETNKATRLFSSVFPAFVIGMVGYFLVPAMGPWKAFPELFYVPIEGYFLTPINAAMVVQGSPVFDVFPSLHALITLVMLHHDWRYRPKLFRLMLPISVVLIISTMYLRYHYAIDLIAALFIFLLIILSRGFFERRLTNE